MVSRVKKLRDLENYPDDPVVGIFRETSLTPVVGGKPPLFKDIPQTNLFITDPPYNIGKKYGKNVNDKMSKEDYSKLLGDTFDRCWDEAADDAHLFIIHRPEAIAEHWDELTRKWDFCQFISWVYPTNTGHSKNQFTRAHREILWLTKGDPHFYSRGVPQRFKNRSVKVVKEKVKQGITGVALYDWWVIPQVKNISEEYQGYENQIPSEVLRRIILCASKPGDWVGDPFSGSFSTARTALRLGRKAWGCDINPDNFKKPTDEEPETNDYRPILADWEYRDSDPVLPNVDSDPYDDVLKHITSEKLDKVLFRLLKEADEETLKKIIGWANGPRVYKELRKN